MGQEPSPKVIHIKFDDNDAARDLFGPEDVHLKSMENSLGLNIRARGSDIQIEGNPSNVEVGERILNELYQMIYFVLSPVLR